MTDTITINAMPTPNPNTLKFVVNTVLVESGTADFPNQASATGSPLAAGLFGIPGVTGVFIGSNFITVTKTSNDHWNELAGSVVNTIRSVLASGVTIVSNTHMGQTTSSDSHIEQMIRDILDREIRPAVAMDGGDITFHSYHDGVVTLHLRGACSSCPASIMTLKMGVENRLKETIPEVREVVQV